jgi:hypothetical protein
MADPATSRAAVNLNYCSQVNDKHAGVLISRKDAEQPFRHNFEEARRLIGISGKVRLSAEAIEQGGRRRPGRHHRRQLEAKPLRKAHHLQARQGAGHPHGGAETDKLIPVGALIITPTKRLPGGSGVPAAIGRR